MLDVTNLQKTFGGLVAVKSLSFQVPDNSILGLIGVNGSGKTTVMNCINGIYHASGGSIRFGGTELAGRRPHEVTRLGIGRTFQVPRLFRRLTLIENLLIPVLGTEPTDKALTDKAEALLDEVDLHRIRDNYAEELSGGQQKLVELLRVMMFDPALILLDEPFAGVHPNLCRVFIDQIVKLKERGKSFILVSHDMTSVYRLSDHILVLNQGETIAEGNASDIQNNPAVVEAFLGR
ncbi:MAG: ABC transporter ATP-binding protein [Gammaproteobacteria bacterium]|nr:ABC transporter ATP-binding protein [Gammaproteobacteria bacterium]MBU1442149.1 ABC transporter ATP-binding protein [Gammaproteobacteria bacterium]MBU2289366.1 ABC transporter ATP-binding protein [Gammaproteobacteria bacterium]MBU2410845.1 ABC transporter ATP-binding protein [Gammaproteobacteria bacterium]